MRLKVSHRLADLVQQAGKIPGLAEDAARQAVARTLPRGRDAVYAAMGRGFDRPTPWALNSLTLQMPQEAGALQGAVMVKGPVDVRGSGVPGQSFLRAEILGGARRWKRSEIALRKSGLLPVGWYAVPGSAARMDGYGNMTRGHVLEVLDFLKAIRPDDKVRKSATKNKTRERRKRGVGTRHGYEYFVVLPGSRRGLAPGVWLRQIATRRAAGPAAPVRQVLTYVKQLRYGKRLDFFGELQRATAAELPAQLERALKAVRLGVAMPDVR